MSGTSRIPRTIPAFNTYINSSDDYLQATPSGGSTPNYQRLGLTNPQATGWSDKRVYWRDTLYPLYSNVNTRTKTVNQNVKQFIKDCHTLGNPLLNIMAASTNATTDDANALNFMLLRKKPTHPTDPITDDIAVGSTFKGTILNISFRSSHDTKRASLAEGADSVQLLYKIGDPAPTDINDTGLKSQLITKATYKHAIDSNDSGKKLYFYVRWYNTKYPNIANGWSKLYTIVLV